MSCGTLSFSDPIFMYSGWRELRHCSSPELCSPERKDGENTRVNKTWRKREEGGMANPSFISALMNPSPLNGWGVTAPRKLVSKLN